jgi:hypothetical protein
MNAPTTPNATTIVKAFPQDANVPSAVVTGSSYLTGHQPSSGTIDRMPDDGHLPMPRPDPERIDLGRIQSHLEFLTERVERFRKDQVLKPLYTMVGSAAIVIAWIELFWRHCL